MKVIEDNQAESSKKRQASELAMNNYVKSVTLYCQTKTEYDVKNT